MQAQIEIRKASQTRGLLVWMAGVALALALLVGIALVATVSSGRAGAPAQVTSTDSRPFGVTQQPQHGNLAGEGAAAGESSNPAVAHGQLP